MLSIKTTSSRKKFSQSCSFLKARDTWLLQNFPKKILGFCQITLNGSITKSTMRSVGASSQVFLSTSILKSGKVSKVKSPGFWPRLVEKIVKTVFPPRWLYSNPILVNLGNIFNSYLRKNNTFFASNLKMSFFANIIEIVRRSVPYISRCYV